jgi:hypothetical protein
MSWLYVLDTNEQTHAAASGCDLRGFLTAQMCMPVEVRPLTVGDGMLVWREADGGEERVYAVFERKAMPDMVASIKDRRYLSQAARLEACGAPHVYWVVVDGELADRADVDRVDSAIAHLASPDYPHIVPLRVRDSRIAYASTVQRLSTYLRGDGTLADVPLYTAVREAGARVRLDTQPVVWLEQLTLVHGMSRKSARAVAAVHPTAVSLLRAFRRAADAHRAAPPSRGRKRPPTLDDSLDAVLADVPLDAKRRLGPACAAALRRTLVPDAAELDAVLP